MTNQETTAADGKGVPKEIKKQLLHYMKLTREIEYRVERVLYRQGKIVGGVYVGRGQEAISVGTGMLMREDDVVAPTHRDMGIFLIRGSLAETHHRPVHGEKNGCDTRAKTATCTWAI